MNIGHSLFIFLLMPYIRINKILLFFFLIRLRKGILICQLDTLLDRLDL